MRTIPDSLVLPLQSHSAASCHHFSLGSSLALSVLQSRKGTLIQLRQLAGSESVPQESMSLGGAVFLPFSLNVWLASVLTYLLCVKEQPGCTNILSFLTLSLNVGDSSVFCLPTYSR